MKKNLKKVLWYAKCRKGLETSILRDTTPMKDCIEKMEPGESFKNQRVQFGPFVNEKGYDPANPNVMHYCEVSES
jgi:hypothetical protein